MHIEINAGTLDSSKLRLGLVALLVCMQTSPTLAASQQEAFREHTKLGITYFQQEKLAAAEQEFRKDLQLNPNVPGLQDLMGVVLDRQGKHQEATSFFLEAIDQDPRYAPAHHHLVSIIFV